MEERGITPAAFSFPQNREFEIFQGYVQSLFLLGQNSWKKSFMHKTHYLFYRRRIIDRWCVQQSKYIASRFAYNLLSAPSRANEFHEQQVSFSIR